jgi:hypothetical protein
VAPPPPMRRVLDTLDAVTVSPSQHASKHAQTTGRSVVASFEPGEDWFFDYETQRMFKGPELVPPHSHPNSQPAPGQAGRVPSDWESRLN